MSVPLRVIEDGPNRLVFPCHCGGEHETPYQPTETPGLVIVDQVDIWCEVRETGHHVGWWTITHLPTGCSLPGNFNDVEDAIACAHDLQGVWDWTLPYAPTGDALLDAGGILRGYACPAPRKTASEPEVLNGPEAVAR